MEKIELRNQNTIGKGVSFKSATLHKGCTSIITLNHSDKDTGILFKLNNSLISADLYNAKADSNMTYLSDGANNIYCTEHLLSALKAMEIDNCVIEVQKCPEIPWGDGSSIQFIEIIKKAGIKKQNAKVFAYVLDKEIIVKENDRMIKAVPSSNIKAAITKGSVIGCKIKFNNIIGAQNMKFNFNKNDYIKEIAKARSFFSAEITDEHIKSIFPGYSENTVIRFSKKDFFTRLRFKDECARHKILDFIGDFSLLNRNIIADFYLVKSGHKLHLELAREVLYHLKKLT